MKTIAEAFKATVRAEVAKGGHAKWGEVESANVLRACIAAGAQESGLDETEALALADNVLVKGKLVINPSAFAQFLEKQPATGYNAEGEEEKGGTFPHPSRIVRPKRGTGGSKAEVEV